MRLIDADALKLSMMLIAPGETKKYCYPCREILKEINDAPTIEERKTGKWMVSYLEHEAMGIRPKLLYCSECCQCIAYSTNFCPNCGADMKGE